MKRCIVSDTIGNALTNVRFLSDGRGIKAVMDRKCTPVMKETRARFTLVDGLRGLAAMSVVLYHAVEGNHITALYSAMPETMRALLENGNSGVAIFFVLSGFVIAHSLDGQTLTGWSAGRFMAKRSVRLDPPYWVAIGMTMLFSTLAAAVVKGRPIEEYSLPQIVAHVFYLQDLLGFRKHQSGLSDALLRGSVLFGVCPSFVDTI